MNRINAFIIVFISVALTAVVVYVFINDYLQKDPEVVSAPLKIEVYRIDRFPLPEADIYLDQRFIGRTDENGFFLKSVNLTLGESHTLRIEKDRNGYFYGPWETNFKFAGEEQERRKVKEEVDERLPSIEGEFDILSEVERAELGRASLYEKYHFLAILDGNMHYAIKVTGKDNVAVEDATVIVNGKIEGNTDKKGVFVVQYSGEDEREENIQIVKEGEHIWQNQVKVHPNFQINVELNKMLIIDLYTYTENYDVIRGIVGAKVFLGDVYMGETGEAGNLLFKYVNNKGVDGYLELSIQYPEGYFPDRQIKTFFVEENLPKLNVSEFAYRKNAVSPRISVMPLMVREKEDYLFAKRARKLKREIEDYLSLGRTFSIVTDKSVLGLFRQFNVVIKKEGTNWNEIPFLKKEVDGIIFGELGKVGNFLEVKLYGIDYTGEIIAQTEKRVALRELNMIPDTFADQFKSNFPFEGNISAIDKNISINLGKRHGIEPNDKFHCFLNYFDEVKNDYSRKRVAKLRIIDVRESTSTGELESIAEGYLLEPGGKLKRFSEPVQALKQIPFTIIVTSGRKRLPGVNIYLDDQWTGQTNENGELKFIMTESIYGDILVYKEGYIPEKVGLKDQEGENKLRFNLRQGKTLLIIDSEPRGALLFINEVYRGSTPIVKKAIEVPYGFHRIELKLDGYKNFNKYLKFSEKKMSFTGNKRIKLWEDYYKRATDAYIRGDIDDALEILKAVSENHPDYKKSMEFVGYIYLNDIKDYVLSIGYFNRVLDVQNIEIGSGQSLISYQNMGQAHYNRAEELFYEDGNLSQQHYRTAISAFNFVRENRSRLQGPKRRNIYQDVLFYLSVSYQKLYYLTEQDEYITRAYYSWIDYFDFFDNNLLRESYFQKQYAIAESYRVEAKRLRSEK